MKKQKKSVNKLNKYFLLNGKKILLIIGAFFLSVILHNLFYALSEISGWNLTILEVSFFLVAVILVPLYFFVSFIYTGIEMIKNKTIFEKKFIIRIVMAVIAGIIASWIVIKTTFVNEPAFSVLAVVFTMIFYYLIKSFIS